MLSLAIVALLSGSADPLVRDNKQVSQRAACLCKFGTECYLSPGLLQPPTVACSCLCDYFSQEASWEQREAEAEAL